jgi:hypothetical protein
MTEEQHKCFNCDGRGVVYELEHYPTDPDNPSVNAEICPTCMGETYINEGEIRCLMTQ